MIVQHVYMYLVIEFPLHPKSQGIKDGRGLGGGCVKKGLEANTTSVHVSVCMWIHIHVYECAYACARITVYEYECVHTLCSKGYCNVPGNFRFRDRIRLFGVSDLDSSFSTSIPSSTANYLII